MIKTSALELNIESDLSGSGWQEFAGGSCKGERERLCKNPHNCSLSLAHQAPPLSQLQSRSFVSVVFTWWSSSWTCPCWRWRRGAPSCWAGVGVSWRGAGLGWAYWRAGVCSCRPEPRYGKHCGCSSLMWKLSTPSKLRLQAAWLMMNPIKLKEEMSPGRRKSKTKEGLVDRMETEA